MNGRGLEAPARPNTLNICTLIVFHCLGHSRPSHSQAFKIPPSPSNRSLTSIKKRQKNPTMMHFIIWALSLSANLFILILLDATPTEKHLMAALSLGKKKKKFCRISHLRLGSETFGLCKTNFTVRSQQQLFWMENNYQMEISVQIGWDWLNAQLYSHKTKAGQRRGKEGVRKKSCAVICE